MMDFFSFYTYHSLLFSNSHKLINLSKIHSFIIFVFLKGLVSEFSITLPPCLLYFLISTCKSCSFCSANDKRLCQIKNKKMILH